MMNYFERTVYEGLEIIADGFQMVPVVAAIVAIFIVQCVASVIVSPFFLIGYIASCRKKQ